MVLGGDGSFRGVSLFVDGSDIKVVGVLCMIDNDIFGIDYVIGFDMVCNIVLCVIDKICDIVFSFN